MPGYKAKNPCCSYKCSWELKGKNKLYINCLFCKKKKRISPSKKSSSRFCSKECFYKYNRGKNTYQWKGRRKTQMGYVIVKDDSGKRSSGYIYEHRKIIEEHLGRELNRNESVHHINGNKSDNRIINLEVTSSHNHALMHNNKRKRNRLGRFIS